MTLAHDVSDTLSSDVGRRIQPTFGYYRQPNGWITISPNTRLERLKYVEQGWTYLDAYGAFDMTAYTASHPLEGLFMFGGAKEMSVEQILQTGLYIDPPLVPRCRQHLTQFHRAHRAACWNGAVKVEFPQLANVPAALIGPFVCEFCKRKLPTVEARQQHQSVVHEEQLGNIQTGGSLGKALADALNKQGSTASSTANLEREQLLARIAELEAKAQPVATALETCGCGGTYKKGGTTLHRRGPRHKKWEATQSPVKA